MIAAPETGAREPPASRTRPSIVLVAGTGATRSSGGAAAAAAGASHSRPAKTCA
jgi:hypothetical protein